MNLFEYAVVPMRRMTGNVLKKNVWKCEESPSRCGLWGLVLLKIIQAAGCLLKTDVVAKQHAFHFALFRYVKSHP